MRLLNTATIKFEELPDNKTLNYAILSHTWGNDEVLFHDLDDPSVSERLGYTKIKWCCSVALSDGFEHVWIDTCCIDKTSSAELSYAINSMFNWYRDAQVCYVYLSDVPGDQDPQHEGSAFAQSRWFTRGWTLQELLAPLTIVFYSKDWIEIGTKSSLQEIISSVTGISEDILLGSNRDVVSVAKRMSWAAKRETTRVEDMAYSLMGLFGVNMPLLYGERENAFVRLQQEIMKISDDHSLFAWTERTESATSPRHGVEEPGRGLLARSPAEFINSGEICCVEYHRTLPYSTTNQGIRLQVPLFALAEGDHTEIFGGKDGQLDYKNSFLALLNCNAPGWDGPLGIFFKKDPRGTCTRARPDKIYLSHKEHLAKSQLHIIYVKETIPALFDTDEKTLNWSYCFSVDLTVLSAHGFDRGAAIRGSYSNFAWDHPLDTVQALLLYLSDGESQALMFESKDQERFVLLLGIHHRGMWSDVVTNFGAETLQDIWRSYRGSKYGRGHMRSLKLDRVRRPMGTERSLILAIKAGLKGSSVDYHVSMYVSTTKLTWWYTHQVRAPQASCSKYSIFVSAIGDFQEEMSQGLWSEQTHPGELWAAKADSRILNISKDDPGNGDLGVIVLRSRRYFYPAAIVLGMKDGQLWSDIISGFGTETASEIEASYLPDGKRAHKVLQKTTAISRLATMCLTLREKRFLNEGEYNVDISIV